MAVWYIKQKLDNIFNEIRCKLLPHPFSITHWDLNKMVGSLQMTSQMDFRHRENMYFDSNYPKIIYYWGSNWQYIITGSGNSAKQFPSCYLSQWCPHSLTTLIRTSYGVKDCIRNDNLWWRKKLTVKNCDSSGSADIILTHWHLGYTTVNLNGWFYNIF